MNDASNMSIINALFPKENLEPLRKKPKLANTLLEKLFNSSPDTTCGLQLNTSLRPSQLAEICRSQPALPLDADPISSSSSDEDECHIVSVETVSIDLKLSNYDRMISTCKYLDPNWLSDLSASTSVNNQDPEASQLINKKQAIGMIESSVEFWDKQRQQAKSNALKRLEDDFASLITIGPVIRDPYIEPCPVPEGLPYKRSIFKPKPKIPVLSEEQWSLVENKISCVNSETVVVDKFRLCVSGKDIHSLLGANWLTDMIINFYLQLIHHRSLMPSVEGVRKTAVMSTFFYPKLASSGFDAVKRWTRKVDLFKHELVLFPIHDRGIHWCIAVADLINKTIVYYDSLGGSNNTCISKLFDYLKAEHVAKLGKSIPDLDEWQLSNAKSTSPQQNNGSDCGVFACMTGEFLSRNADLNFEQDHMPSIRQRMLYEIIYQQLLTTETDLSKVKDD